MFEILCSNDFKIPENLNSLEEAFAPIMKNYTILGSLTVKIDNQGDFYGL